MLVESRSARASEAELARFLEEARLAERSGEFENALRFYEVAFTEAVRAGDAPMLVDLLRWMGTVQRARGELELASELYEASLASARAHELSDKVASALNCLAVVAQTRAQVDEATRLYWRARAIADATGNDRLAAMIDQNLGTMANTRGEFEAALASYTSALQRFRRLGDNTATAWSLNNLGMLHVDLGEFAAAEERFGEALTFAEVLGDRALLGTIELNRAELHLKQWNFTRARECCDAAFEIFTHLDARSHLGETYKFYGVLYREMGKPALAKAHFTDAARFAEAVEDRLLEAEVYSEWAGLHLALHENQQALQRLNQAHHLFADLHANPELLDLDGRLDKLESTYLKVVRQWAESIESKDLYTAGHCERVAEYACMLAAALGFEGRDLNWLRMGGFLHDVGKIDVPAEILNKPGRLTDHEMDAMRAHTTAGARIVTELNFPWDILPVVRNHHERWDGTGYPDGLAGERIPLTARILCVADIFDALTTTRSYRPALSVEEALRIMESEAGVIVDPNIFDLFKSLVRAGRADHIVAAHPKV
ncbi:MAG TPA: HD domain-containing phosphohydrolase [Woeseiaceae bacterium]